MTAYNDRDEIGHGDPRELPAVDAPPLSPAEEFVEHGVDHADLPSAETDPGFRLSRRPRSRATLAASLALVAGLGALIGAAVSNHFSDYDRADLAGVKERKAMQQSIAHLTQEVAVLKASLATATTRTQVANLSGRADAIVTGSVPGAKAVPMPRPAPSLSAPMSRPVVVSGWRIRGERRGVVYVGGHGRRYRAVAGAQLPGLGPVQSVERRDGRWVVVTPKGIIVSTRDRRHFGG